MISLSSKLIEYLKEKYPGFVHGAELEDVARGLGFKGRNAGRRLRELYNKGIVEREYRFNDGVRIVYYKAHKLFMGKKYFMSDITKSQAEQLSLKL